MWLFCKIFSGFSEADIARSLLFTVSNDIGQIASLYAMLHGLKKVSVFGNVNIILLLHNEKYSTSLSIY